MLAVYFKGAFMISKKLRLPILILFVTIGIYACVIIPLLQYLGNDVVLRDTPWFDTVDLLSYHFEIVGSILLLELLVFAVYRYSFRDAKSLVFLAACALGFKYLAAVIAYSVMFGSLDLTGGLTPYLVSLLLEVAIAVFVLLLCTRTISPVKEAYLARESAARMLQCSFTEENPCYPFRHIFSWKNPILRITLVCALTVFFFQSAAFVISFVSGAPMQAKDIPVLFIYEGLLIALPCAYSYFLARLFFKLCMKKSNHSK